MMIDLPPQTIQAISAKAQIQGVTAEQWIINKLNHALQDENNPMGARLVNRFKDIATNDFNPQARTDEPKGF